MGPASDSAGSLGFWWPRSGFESRERLPRPAPCPGMFPCSSGSLSLIKCSTPTHPGWGSGRGSLALLSSSPSCLPGGNRPDFQNKPRVELATLGTLEATGTRLFELAGGWAERSAGHSGVREKTHLAQQAPPCLLCPHGAYGELTQLRPGGRSPSLVADGETEAPESPLDAGEGRGGEAGTTGLGPGPGGSPARGAVGLAPELCWGVGSRSGGWPGDV